MAAKTKSERELYEDRVRDTLLLLIEVISEGRPKRESQVQLNAMQAGIDLATNFITDIHMIAHSMEQISWTLGEISSMYHARG